MKRKAVSTQVGSELKIDSNRSEWESGIVQSVEVSSNIGGRTCTVVVINPLRIVTTPKLGYACAGSAPATRSIAR